MRQNFLAGAVALDLSAGDCGRQFSTGRETFRVIGIDHCRPKHTISAEHIPEGQGFKFTADQMVSPLQKRMRDMPPGE
jgi:hypothetical protein